MDRRFVSPAWDRPNTSHHLRAKGNLTYLEFIRMVEYFWSETHPDIPFYAQGGDSYAKYPCIVYGLQMRKTMQNEPKMRYREQITGSDNKSYLIGGQRFQNIINFSSITETDPRVAEELIEEFEDFMLACVPAFKELGASEVVYARRLPDEEQNRPGQGVVMRTVSFMVILEKIVKTEVDKLTTITATVRRMIDIGELVETSIDSQVTVGLEDQFAQATPNI